jgi:glycerol kinase
VAGRYLLALDQSTQSTKAFALDASGEIVAKAVKPHKQYYPEAGRVEHDPAEILVNARAALAEAVNSAGIDPADIAALCVTNQRETIVAWDAETGRPLHNALVWQDDRGAPLCAELEAKGFGPLVRGRTGLAIDPYYSASKLAWLACNSEPVRAALAARRLMAGTMDAWLVWNLTGGKVFATDYSNASRTMLFDVRELRWDPELVELFGLTGIRLPEPRCSDAGFGEAWLPGLGITAPIAGVMGDSHAALFGHCGWEAGDAKGSYGTGSSLMLNIGPAAKEPPKGVVLSLAWGFRGKPSYVFEGNIHSTGYTMTWLRDKLGIFATDDEAERLAREIPDNGGVYLVPAFSGLGAPYWEHGIRATITGLSHGSDRRHVARAGLESIAYQVMDLVEAMAANAGADFSSLHVDGGPSRNSFLMQFQADMLGIPVLVPPRDELSAIGVSYMGGLGIGFWRSPEEILGFQAEPRRFEPSMPSETREKLAGEWKSAVSQAIFRKI